MLPERKLKKTKQKFRSGRMSSFYVIELYHCFAALETDAALHFAALALAGPGAVKSEHEVGGCLQGEIT